MNYVYADPTVGRKDRPTEPEVPTMASRSYLVGLPVTVTVDDDGTVTYQIDTGETGVAVKDAWWEIPVAEAPAEEQMLADVAAIEDDHVRRASL